MNSAFDFAEGVFACRLDDSMVVLDTIRDRYFHLSHQQTRWLDTAREGTLNPLSAADRSMEYANFLESKGILERCPEAQRKWGRALGDPARSSVLDNYCEEVSGFTRAEIWRFSQSLISCWFMERFFSLSMQLASVRNAHFRKESKHEIDPIEPTQRFHRLTPYFFTARNNCRFRSFFLVHYLASMGCKTDWVFGVRGSPFEAHCWVEHEGEVLNDHLDYVLTYQRIMVI